MQRQPHGSFDRVHRKHSHCAHFVLCFQTFTAMCAGVHRWSKYLHIMMHIRLPFIGTKQKKTNAAFHVDVLLNFTQFTIVERQHGLSRCLGHNLWHVVNDVCKLQCIWNFHLNLPQQIVLA